MAWRLHYGVLLTADARSESILSPHTKACVIMQCISRFVRHTLFAPQCHLIRRALKTSVNVPGSTTSTPRKVQGTAFYAPVAPLQYLRGTSIF